MSGCCDEPTGFACRLTSPELAARKDRIAQTLGIGAESITKTNTDVVLVFQDASRWLNEIISFVQLERECCPFLAYSIDIDANDGPLTLSIGGSSEAKQFLLSELAEAFPTLAAGGT